MCNVFIFILLLDIHKGYIVYNNILKQVFDQYSIVPKSNLIEDGENWISLRLNIK